MIMSTTIIIIIIDFIVSLFDSVSTLQAVEDTFNKKKDFKKCQDRYFIKELPRRFVFAKGLRSDDLDLVK